MEKSIDLIPLLEYIDPSTLDYQEWVNIGMALKHEGYSVFDWEEWSSKDGRRYHDGECEKKWETFGGAYGSPVTGATITQLAKENGWQPQGGRSNKALDWDDEISDEYLVVDAKWVEGKEVKEPSIWNPTKELITYLSVLFEASENVGYVTDTWQNDEGKFLPTKGSWDRSAGQLIQELNNCNGDIGAVIGDYNTEAGAWIRFNPLDGKGVKNDNVTEFKYALVESDNMEIDKQNAIMRELELPIAVMVYSGKKSIHAIVKVDAANYEEYRKRVDYLYNICKKNGLSVDNQNRNPSRLSRMPGIERNGKKQFIIDTNIGKADWNEWHEWIEDLNDDLPDPEGLADFWENMPTLASPLIEGVLRQGHKMLMAGPSKAGKSFALIELTAAIAEGREWLGWSCAQGRVLYVNLELDSASCLHRFKDVYTALGWEPKNLHNIDIWNLRGKSAPMDKLTPKLIRRAAKKNYIAVIIDPIYKVLTGDENSADQMAKFTGQFDKICTELGASTIYCHHHSKGSQGGKKSMDRASGSGVFARDPDALIDLVELELTESLLEVEENKIACGVYREYIERYAKDYFDKNVGLDDLLSRAQMRDHANLCVRWQMNEIERVIKDRLQTLKTRSAWRVEGTLREYPKFEAKNMWFNYPIHVVDDSGVLTDITPEGEGPTWKKNFDKKKKTPEEAKKERNEALETAYSACSLEEEITLEMLAEYMGCTDRTVRSRIKEHGGYLIVEGLVIQKPGKNNSE